MEERLKDKPYKYECTNCSCAWRYKIDENPQTCIYCNSPNIERTDLRLDKIMEDFQREVKYLKRISKVDPSKLFIPFTI